MHQHTLSRAPAAQPSAREGVAVAGARRRWQRASLARRAAATLNVTGDLAIAALVSRGEGGTQLATQPAQ